MKCKKNINLKEKMDEKKVYELSRLEEVKLKKGEVLFKEGDKNDGLYIIESGILSAYLEKEGKEIRIKKFLSGSLFGELSAYLSEKFRTASVKAEEDCVLFHLNLEKLNQLAHENEALMTCIHEFIAKALATRISFMNKRLLVTL